MTGRPCPADVGRQTDHAGLTRSRVRFIGKGIVVLSHIVGVLALVALTPPAHAASTVDWLLAPISGATEHVISVGIAWHGRLMVFAWTILMPAAIIVARFFKITPRQRWPKQVDNPFWFVMHRRLGYLLVAITLVGVGFITVGNGGSFAPWRNFHTSLGWLVVVLGLLQLIGSLLRGTHGGPVNPFTRQPRPVEQWPGDHFSMTTRRVMFECTHKGLGYVLLPAAITTVATGLEAADAPRWMWLIIAVWWFACAVVFIVLQRVVGCIDTYQAIWGLERTLPGYRRPPIGFGITRFTEDNSANAPWQTQRNR